MPPIRTLTALALVTAFACSLTAPAAAGDRVSVLLTICLPQPIPVLTCPPPPGPGGEPQPASVTSTTARKDPTRIVLRFKRGTTASVRRAVLRRANVRLERAMPKVGFYVVRVSSPKQRDAALRSLGRERSVAGLQREIALDAFATTPGDPMWPDQWGLRTTAFPQAWDITRGSKAVVVAVLDTGVDATHPELQGALVKGRDIVNRDDDPSDDNGHGTAVAGIVAARANNGVGIAGACWSCLVMPVKVLGADGSGTTTDVAAGIVWAAEHGASVINLSLGAPGTTTALGEALDYAMEKDVVVVAAAGNSSSAAPYYPAADPMVLGVAATSPDDQLYSWSNRGAWVKVAAPGCNTSIWPNNGYVGFCGTSSAAPVVAGIAALVRSARPKATASEVEKAIAGDVDAISADVRSGRVNAYEALTGVGASAASTRASRAFRGTLGRQSSRRVHRASVGAGKVVAVLRFTGRRRLTLLLSQNDRRTVRVSCKSPLRLKANASAGAVALVVEGRRGRAATYRLTLSYAAP